MSGPLPKLPLRHISRDNERPADLGSAADLRGLATSGLYQNGSPKTTPRTHFAVPGEGTDPMPRRMPSLLASPDDALGSARKPPTRLPTGGGGGSVSPRDAARGPPGSPSSVFAAKPPSATNSPYGSGAVRNPVASSAAVAAANQAHTPQPIGPGGLALPESAFIAAT